MQKTYKTRANTSKVKKNIWISCHKRLILICKEAIQIDMKGENNPIDHG